MFSFLRNSQLFCPASSPLYKGEFRFLRSFPNICFFESSHSCGYKWYLIVLICISVLTNDLEHFSVYLLTICIFSLEKCLFKPFAHFLIWLSLSFCSWVIKVNYIFWIYLWSVYDLEIISLILWCLSILFFKFNLLNLSVVGIQYYVGYINFRCMMWWFDISIACNVITPLILVIICHHANLSQYYWLYCPFLPIPHPLHSGNHPFGLFLWVCFCSVCLFLCF